MTNTTAVPDLPEPDQRALNDAAWKFINNATGEIPAPLWNNLKAALWPAISHYIAATQPAPSGDAVQSWRDAVLDQCAITYMPFHEDNPRKTIEDLIKWHVDVSHDPDVSDRAKDEKMMDGYRRALEIIAVGDASNERQAACDALIASGFWLPDATPKPEASAANQQAGLLNEALHWIENSTENAPSLCGDIRKALGLSAAPISEGTENAAAIKHLDARIEACIEDLKHEYGITEGAEPAAPAASNGDALPPKPKCKMLSGSNLDSLHALYTADQMDAYVLADRAARAGTGSAGSIGDDAEFNRLVMCIAAAAERKGGYPKERQDLVAYIDTRATKVEATPQYGLTAEELEFVMRVNFMPGAKLNSGEAVSSDAAAQALWVSPQKHGLIEAVGGWKWRITDKGREAIGLAPVTSSATKVEAAPGNAGEGEAV